MGRFGVWCPQVWETPRLSLSSTLLAANRREPWESVPALERCTDNEAMSTLSHPSDLTHVPETIAVAVTTFAGTNARSDPGPFFHGTSQPLQVGSYLVAGRPSNYRPEVVMNTVYNTNSIFCIHMF